MAEGNDLKYLMSRFVANTCTREEFERLLVLIENADEDEELTDEMRQCWDNIETSGSLSSAWRERFSHMLDKTAVVSPGVVRRMHVRRWIVAAAAMLALTAGYLGRRSRESGVLAHAGVAAVTGKTKTVAAIDRNRAVVTVADGYKTIVTPKGSNYYIVLNDGTRVWLNAASSLRFRTEAGPREVALTGEAFFEVTRNSHRPFYVRAGKISVEVLGTKFNVSAYREEGRVSATLVQGKIKVIRSSGSTGVLLKPGIQATLADNGTLTLDQAPNMEEVLAWKNGNFNFVNTPVPEILRQIARWYDLEIVYEGAPPDKQLTGTFSRSVGLDQLTNMLRYAGVNMRIEKNRLLILPN